MDKNDHREGAPGQVKDVTSLANPIVKSIRALSRKRNRDEEGVFIAEGLKLIIEARDLGWTVRTLVISKNAAGTPLIDRLAAGTVAAGGLVLRASEKVLSAITRRDNPQSAVAVISQRHPKLPAPPTDKDDVWIALDRVRDPGNLGTVIRTADAAGARGVILVGDCTDPYAIETVRATMGSIFALPVVRVSNEEFLAWRQSWPGLVAGTHLAGSVDYRTVDYSASPVLLVMGNEQQGLPEDLASACDVLVRIPQAGRADSLNLAVATAVILFEARRHALRLEG
jgi:TrmH family RNA methyltransferase